ncbi:hypothetical protein TH53_07390 [Pedobacter lusitanus]|uniref:Lipoprotein n=1 Tax=Pedobacter lusitanus TaxID=1503925 RepID=A0A0D0GTF9_9SPHI|nr:hypothetical protein [Pedobacter lusitanus]KIO77746.1 hypothetical protein TH53_07390 [Pedobacter lusitanus]
MKTLWMIIIIAAITGCHDKPKAYDESRELIPDPEGYQKDTIIQSTKDSALVSDTLIKKKKSL